MKKLLIVLLSSLSMQAFAQDQQADAELVAELVQYCQEIADEDGTGDQSLTDYLLSCVNEELESEGFATLKTLPNS